MTVLKASNSASTQISLSVFCCNYLHKKKVKTDRRERIFFFGRSQMYCRQFFNAYLVMRRYHNPTVVTPNGGDNRKSPVRLDSGLTVIRVGTFVDNATRGNDVLGCPSGSKIIRVIRVHSSTTRVRESWGFAFSRTRHYYCVSHAVAQLEFIFARGYT